jgi:hypothetical protein
LLERTVSLKIEEAYANLRVALLEKGCKVLSEQPPRQISVKQGSLWGITPKTAKKTINIDLEVVDSGTRVTFSSKLAADWKNITVVGCALAAVLVGVCFWIAADLSAFMLTSEPSFWSWIFGNTVDLQAGQVFVNLTWGLAVFLSIIILLEIVIVVYVHSKIDAFAQETLSTVKAQV